MGTENTKIDTSSVPLQEIVPTYSSEQGRFCPPFRKFKNQELEINDKVLKATVEVEEPLSERITVS
jgi:hypothetical protein